jgi:AcrR family transcriptional regulator
MTDEQNQSNRAEITREKLLSAALDVFGRYGFDGTSTRQLSEAAGVNLQAIPYYFGGKEGLYVATAEYLVSRIDRHVGSLRQQIGAHLMALEAAGQTLSEEDARRLLTEMGMIGTILQEDPASEHVRLRTLAFVGNIMVFRVAHAAVLAQMEWQSVGAEQLQTLRNLVAELVGQLRQAKGNTE